MRLLIIEDEAGIASALRTALIKLYHVDIVKHGQDGLEKAEKHPYGAVILDLNLPDMPGLQVCQELRRSGYRGPIIILTGETRILSKVTLLDAGADDYLTKPFSLEELKARLRVLLRRHDISKPTGHTLRTADVMLDPQKHLVERAGQQISLRRKEFALLECLMLNAGKVVTRDTLAHYAWKQTDDVWTNTVDVHIKNLRDKVDRPFSAPIIKTVHGLGYKLETNLADSSV